MNLCKPEKCFKRPQTFSDYLYKMLFFPRLEKYPKEILRRKSLSAGLWFESKDFLKNYPVKKIVK